MKRAWVLIAIWLTCSGAGFHVPSDSYDRIDGPEMIDRQPYDAPDVPLYDPISPPEPTWEPARPEWQQNAPYESDRDLFCTLRCPE